VTVTHLLDTSVYSQPIKNVPMDSAMNRWHDLGDESVCTSAICHAEVLKGLEERDSERMWSRYREIIEGQYPVLPFDEKVAAVFATLCAIVRRRGKTCPAFDLMIAATAKHYGLILATLNARHFEEIPGVAVEVWSE